MGLPSSSSFSSLSAFSSAQLEVGQVLVLWDLDSVPVQPPLSPVEAITRASKALQSMIGSRPPARKAVARPDALSPAHLDAFDHTDITLYTGPKSGAPAPLLACLCVCVCVCECMCVLARMLPPFCAVFSLLSSCCCIF